MPKKAWTPEEKKAFGEKMKAARMKKPQLPDQTSEYATGSEAAKSATPDTKNDPVASKLAELDEALKQTHVLNAKLEAQSKEQSDRFENGMKGMSVQQQGSVIQSHESKAQKQKTFLATQAKVKIFVPLEGKEKPGTQLPVTINGYRVNVPKGVYCEVPEQIAQIVMDSLNQTEAAVNNPKFLIDADERKETALG